jgi:exopolyphosphatase/guanosine-5'-triphosphate,3'-diphosphate pyrophosphatase
MPRLAAIDIGTNTVLLCVADVSEAGLTPVLDRSIITRLGQGLDRAGTLDPQAIERTLEALEAHARTAREAGAERIAAAGTAALREARDADRFLSEAKRCAGIEIEVISGETEAALALEAVAREREESASRNGAVSGPLLVMDIGGGSTEFIAGEGRSIRWARSLPVGSVRLTERFLRHDPAPPEEIDALIRHVRGTFANLPDPPGTESATMVGIAGTYTTLVAMKLRLRAYDAAAIRRTPLAMADLDALIAALAPLTARERLALPGLEPGRADVILAGAAIAREGLARFGRSAIGVTDRGVRHGVLYRMAERPNLPSRFLKEE